MADIDFWIKKGDVLPKLSATFKDSSGAAIDLTGATVKLRMRAAGGALKFFANATITSPTAGKVEYQWISTDTDTAGDFNAEWVVTFGGGAVQTVPNTGSLKVRVVDTLA